MRPVPAGRIAVDAGLRTPRGRRRLASLAHHFAGGTVEHIDEVRSVALKHDRQPKNRRRLDTFNRSPSRLM